MIGALIGNVVGAGLGAWSAHNQQKKAERKADRARKEMNRQKRAFSALDTSNPYLNMENTMEDLTVNQQAAQMQNQQFQQSQANVLGGMRGAAGGSGVAGVAQALAQQGQLAAQQSSADIGRQESANQMARQQMAGQIQSMERQGEVYSRNLERDKVGTLLGMAQQETAAYRDQAASAQQAKMDAISGGISNITSLFG
jgi:hypothetical protein